MAIRAEVRAEPIPGYTLMERLGGGGVGEVWKAEAPGGILKAIKFVHGTLNSATEDGGVQQELRSLNRVKSVRHPYILSLERYDIIDGQLMIVMELADKNLWERFREFTSEGQPGIPRAELLRYMEESAEALDLMNIQYGLQHLDIKPQNLFLVHNHVKVADFGLVKDLEGMNTQVTGGVTPIYAAPETFDGVISRYCDQYNLAIVYQELLTGQRPFNGTTARQLLMQHLKGTPDLSSLPECDRNTIGRALAKKPEERFPSCTDLVHELQANSVGNTVKEAARPMGPAAVLETPPVIRTSPTVTAEKKPTPAAVEPEVAPAPTPTVLPEVKGDGILFPALIIGLGRIGLRVVQQLRVGLHEQAGPATAWPHLQFLFIDSDPETASRAANAGMEHRLAEQEIVLARLNRPSHYLRPNPGKAILESWLNMGMVCRLPRNQTSTEGLRVLGRLAFADNYSTISEHIRTGLAACTNPSALATADRHTRLGVGSNRPRVYVVTSLGGGTGSGMFIDVAYTVKHELRAMGMPECEVVGMFMLPPADVNNRQSLGLVNTFASLIELNHFGSSDVKFSALFEGNREPMANSGPAFDRCMVLPLPEESVEASGLREITCLAGDYLARELISPLGKESARMRNELPQPGDDGMTCQTFGSYRLYVPTRQLMRRTSRALMRTLIERWIAADRPGLRKAVRDRIDDECTKLGLEPDSLIESLQNSCAEAMHEDPEVAFANAIHKHLSPEGNFDSDSAIRTLESLEAIVGQPVEEGSTEVSSPMVEALDTAAQAVQKQWEAKLSGLIKSMVDDSRFRIGGAEDAGKQITLMLREVIQRHEPLLKEITARAEEAYLAIDDLLVQLQKGSWWPGRITKVTGELRDTFNLYAKLRFQTLVLECVLDVYSGLIKKLPKRLEEITFCRQRVGEIHQAIEESRKRIDLHPGRAFLLSDAQTPEEAVDGILREVREEDLAELDQKIQLALRRQSKSVLAMCLESDEALGELILLLRQQVESWAEAYLGQSSVAELFLQDHPSDEDAGTDLAAIFEEARPALVGSRASRETELSYLLVPADPGGDHIAQLAPAVLENLEVVSGASVKDIYCYREFPQLLIADLPQLGLMAEDAYQQSISTGHFSPHTRCDITDWKPPT